MPTILKKLSPGRIIALGFILMILLGSVLLVLPCSVKDGMQVSYIDALYTSTSAVCVTGLIAVDAGSHFTLFGKIILGILIQVGGLGVTSISTWVILAVGRKVNLKGRNLLKEALNTDSPHGVIKLVKSVFLTTVIIECMGAILSFISFFFIHKIPFWRAVGWSIFHSVAAFNNSGFDIFGDGLNMISYQKDVLLNLVTCGMVFFGGIGFLVIREVITKRFRWRKMSMHTKVVLVVSLILTVAGTLLLKFTEGENISWLGAFFHSVSARTAGFSSYPLGKFSAASLLVLIVLMFIGASPGSTGGGIKTSTIFVLFQGIKSAATNKQEKAFHYSVPRDAFRRAAVIALLAIGVITFGTFCICMLEPASKVSFLDALFEMSSAFGTVGLSTGITGGLSVGSKLVSICIMYIGRLGPLTVASLWYFNKGERVSYPIGNISIG